LNVVLPSAAEAEGAANSPGGVGYSELRGVSEETYQEIRMPGFHKRTPCKPKSFQNYLKRCFGGIIIMKEPLFLNFEVRNNGGVHHF
jgi:hypothetical protein